MPQRNRLPACDNKLVESAFEKTFTKLNDEQKRAAKYTDGPLLVVAGPGTGKTQLLSARVAYILKNTDARANNILCLTYTNKAAINMKERVIKLAGQEGARVQASTFHSFAAEIMNLYPDYFWNSAQLSAAPDAQQLEVIESIVSKLPFDNPLAQKFAGQYTLLNSIKDAIKLVKEAGLTPNKLRAVINHNLAYIDKIESQLADITTPSLSFKKLGELKGKVDEITEQNVDEALYPLRSLSTIIQDSLAEAIAADEETGKTTNTGKWKSRWAQNVAGVRGMHKERERNSWWMHLADVYEKYRDALHQRGYFDFSDMLVEVLAQLDKRPEMLADIQERFNYVLIDEFQDTTPAQLRLARLVAEHEADNGRPNLMAVGDDDQTIYRFNGADLSNMLGFKKHYPAAKIIVLTKNYRSTQKLIDQSKKIITQARSRLVNADKTLDKNLVAANPPLPGGITARSYASRELQLSETARVVKKMYSPKRTIAVLARGHESLRSMAALLQKLDVPVRYEQSSNSLDHEIVKQVHLVSKLLLAVQNGDKHLCNALIHQIVRWPAWGLDPIELWRLAERNYPNKPWLPSLLNSKSAKIKALGEWFVWLAGNEASQPLAITLEQIIGLRASRNFTSPIRDYFLKIQEVERYFHGLSAIQLLRATVHEFGADAEPTLSDLVRFIDINKQNGVVVADESPFVTGNHAVQLLTVHKAKGLEFDQVFVIDAIERNWRPRGGRRVPPANLPLQPNGDDADDFVRLMYVAATRAKSGLCVTSYYQDHSGQEVATSTIVQGAFKIMKVKQNDKEKLLEVLEENLRWPKLDGGLEKEIIKARLEEYNLSSTHLQNFLNIKRGGPQYFKERNLLNLPEAKAPHLSFGTAIHAAMDLGQKMTNQGDFGLDEVTAKFKSTLRKEQMEPAQYSRYLEKGQKTLTQLFGDFGYKLPRGSQSEQKIKDVRLGRAVLSGNLDRVDQIGANKRIVDYKTGSVLRSFDTKDKNLSLKAHNHKMQLVFYALLLGAEPRAVEGQMVYLEADNPKAMLRSYAPTEEDMRRLRRLIEAVYEKIVGYNLPDVARYTPDLAGRLAFENDLIDGKI